MAAEAFLFASPAVALELAPGMDLEVLVPFHCTLAFSDNKI